MTDNLAALKKLREPFPPNQIGKLPKGGILLDFVGHAHLTARLLDVDPFWSWKPFAIGGDGLPQLDEYGGLWIELTVCDMTRIGYGDAGGRKGPNAVKEAIGDALRNAAMRFGAALDLWAKEGNDYDHQDSDRPRPDVTAANEARGELLAATKEYGWTPAKLSKRFHADYSKDLLEVTDVELLRKFGDILIAEAEAQIAEARRSTGR